MTATRKTDFIFQRPGSQNWWLKLRSGGKRIEKSLRTADKSLAEIAALPFIAEHKARLYEARPRVVPTWHHLYAPGQEHVGPDGGRIIATDRELMHLNADGRITRTTPNGSPGWTLSSAPRMGIFAPVGNMVAFEPDESAEPRPVVAVKNGDDAVLETYIKHAGVVGAFEREARSVWALWRQLTGGKLLLKDASRDDGRKLVQHFESQGLKSATIKKKVGWLSQAVNLAIAEGVLKFNPFSGVLPRRDDKTIRLPLDDDDMKEAGQHLNRLADSDRVLFRLLATTGMRLSEAFEIDHEMTEGGCRFVIVGSKTDQSLRRVPLPADAIPYLPKAIKGKLFAGVPNDASKRLNNFLRNIGITDPRKVLHSLRHRAQDRLRASGCPEDIREALLGHEQKTVAAGYGKGFPVPLLRKWIDRIGFQSPTAGTHLPP
jgi:integrase